MKKVLDILNMLLQKSKIVLSFFVIALFSVAINSKVYAAEFKYSEFDFDAYFEEKGNIWVEECGDNQKCIDTVIKSQKKFYTKLYKVLSKYVKKGIISDDNFIDNIIIQTVLINLTPGTFSDNPEEYEETWDESKPYEVDENEMDDFDIEPDIDYENISEDYAKYFNDEKDTLKLLVSNLFSYTTKCYGIYGDPTYEKDDDGNEIPVCDRGSLESIPVKNLIKTKKDKCVDKITNSLGFYKYYISKLQHDHYIGKYYTSLSILGLVHPDEYYSQCEDLSSSYPEGTVYGYMDKGELPKLDTNQYFDFLSYNRYFDKKAHLQEYFEKHVLKPAGVECMTKDLCDNSLESAGLYDQYQVEIIEARREIIKDIIWILNNYGIKISYMGVGFEYGEGALNSNNTGWWWPIGSDTFYPNEPIPTTITSNFGSRTDPVTKKTANHRGIDIAPTVKEYKTSGGNRPVPIIATRDGVVTEILLNNASAGNKITLQHDNGMYSSYLHLESVNVTVGQSVKQGEVIGYMGSTGKSTGKHLHFEILTDPSTRVNPLDYVSPLNARPTSSSGKFVSGNENKQSICKTLKSSGFSDNGIAAVLGNIEAESSFLPSADNGSHGGICQWDYKIRYERLKAYRPYDYTKLEGQVMFMIYEMQTYYNSVYSKLINGSGTATELGDVICSNYERPGDSECKKRHDYPDKYLSYVQNNCA